SRRRWRSHMSFEFEKEVNKDVNVNVDKNLNKNFDKNVNDNHNTTSVTVDVQASVSPLVSADDNDGALLWIPTDVHQHLDGDYAGVNLQFNLDQVNSLVSNGKVEDATVKQIDSHFHADVDAHGGNENTGIDGDAISKALDNAQAGNIAGSVAADATAS